MIKIYISVNIKGSNNSNRGKICGKVGFSLQPLRLFIHSQIVEKENFCTASVERFFSVTIQQVISPLSTELVENCKL